MQKPTMAMEVPGLGQQQLHVNDSDGLLAVV
jgi:hypothetical protein